MSNNKLKARSEIDKRYLWNAESVFANRDAWRAELKAVQAALPGLAAKAGTIEKGGAAGLADTLELMLGLLDRVGKLYVYASMYGRLLGRLRIVVYSRTSLTLAISIA